MDYMKVEEFARELADSIEILQLHSQYLNTTDGEEKALKEGFDLLNKKLNNITKASSKDELKKYIKLKKIDNERKVKDRESLYI